jgi:hypothetical protein
MSQCTRSKKFSRIPNRVRTLVRRYAKGNFHTPPDLSSLSESDRNGLLGEAKKERENRLWRILMQGGGVLRAVRWPEYNELVARIRDRDERTASRRDPLTTIERDYVGGNIPALGMYDLCHPTPERAQLIAIRRAKFVKTSLEAGQHSQLSQPDVQKHLLPLVHPSRFKMLRRIRARMRRLPLFAPEGGTRRDRYLRSKFARCEDALRHCWRMIFAHERTLQLFQDQLQRSLWQNRRFPARVA